MMASFLLRQRRVIPAWLALPLLPVLAACSGGSGYPSLARQPVEREGTSGLARAGHCPPGKGGETPCAPQRVTGSAPVVNAAPVIDGAGTVQAAAGVPALVADARAAHARFEGRRADAVAAVSAASGTAPASDPWLRANQALVELDRARADSGSALVELDRIAIDDRLAHALDDPDGTADRPGARPIREGVAVVSGLVEAEDAVLGDLKRRFVGSDK